MLLGNRARAMGVSGHMSDILQHSFHCPRKERLTTTGTMSWHPSRLAAATLDPTPVTFDLRASEDMTLVQATEASRATVPTISA
eukprot:SAG31_NODE_2848_length_5000_cov_1.584575_3_plen_84_part_00